MENKIKNLEFENIQQLQLLNKNQSKKCEEQHV